MNDLRILLEKISFAIDAQNHKAIFEAERLESILKPWPVHSRAATTSNVESATSRESQDDAPNNLDRFTDDVNKIDEMLKHARLVRQGQEQPPQSARRKTELRNSQLTVHERKPAASRKAIRDIGSASKKAGKSSSVVSRTQTTEKSKPKIKVLSASDATKIVNTKLQSDRTPSGSSMDSRVTMPLEDVVKERFLSSKYVKLRQMHEKSRIAASKADRSTCEAEASFISKLALSGGSPVGDCVFSTPDALDSLISAEIDRVQFLLNTLKYKLSYSDEDTSPIALYYRKLAYMQCVDAISDIENVYSQLKNSFVIASANRDGDDDLTFLSHFWRRSPFPCDFQNFDKEIEVVQNMNSVNDLRWVKLNLFLKQRIHSVVIPILHDLIALKEQKKEDLNRDSATMLTSAFGLLAKSNRCAINPAVVKTD